MRVLVTGAAGFIGANAVKALLGQGHNVVGVDSINDYYDSGLKKYRLAQLNALPGFQFHQLDLCNSQGVQELFADAFFVFMDVFRPCFFEKDDEYVFKARNSCCV